jgi:hypothetical protein
MRSPPLLFLILIIIGEVEEVVKDANPCTGFLWSFAIDLGSAARMAKMTDQLPP